MSKIVKTEEFLEPSSRTLLPVFDAASIAPDDIIILGADTRTLYTKSAKGHNAGDENFALSKLDERHTKSRDQMLKSFRSMLRSSFQAKFS